MKQAIEKRHLMWMIILRVAVMSLLLMLALIVGYSASFGFPLQPFIYVVLATYILAGLELAAYATGKYLPAQAYAQVIMDLIMITALVYVWGGAPSSAYILYLLPIIEAGIVISGRASYLAAALAAILFGAMVDGMYFRIIPSPESAGAEALSFGSVLYAILVAWGAFFLVAFLTGQLATRLRKTRNDLAAARRELAVRERLSEAGRVSAGLAHEIRNPLAAIYGSVQVLKSRIRLTDEQAELMDIIMRESLRVSHILDQFLDYALPARETFTSVRLSDVAEETIKLLRASGELDGRIEVAGNYAESPAAVRASSSQMRQVFLNVVKNAVKAMPEGGRLTMNINALKGPEGEEVEMTFSDTGVGMSREDLEKLFDPFFSRFEGGRGLGMAIVRRIADDYDGRVGAVSEPGRGTMVRVVIPAGKPTGN